MTDTEIINLFFERSEQAIEELAKKHGNAVARVARNILGNVQDTEECVTDTYLGTWNAIPPHKPSPLRTYVCKIARNLATMKYHSNTALETASTTLPLMNWKKSSLKAAAWKTRMKKKNSERQSTAFWLP